MGGFLMGQIMDRRGPVACLKFMFCYTFVLFIGTIVYNEFHYFNWTSFVLCLGWGFWDGILINFTNVVLGFEFESKVTTFAVQKFCQNIVSFIFVLINSTVKTKSQFRIYFASYGVFSVFSMLAMSYFEFRKSNKEQQESEVVMSEIHKEPKDIDADQADDLKVEKDEEVMKQENDLVEDQ